MTLGLLSVVAPFSPKGIVFDGDSITHGTGTNSEPTPTYFSTLTAIRNKNVAVNGENLATMDTNYATIVAPLFNPGVYDTLFISGGTNDFGSVGATDLTLRTNIQSYCAKAKATGFRVYVGTITARNLNWNATFEGYRVAYNTWLRSNFSSFSDGLADWDGVIQSQDPANTTYVQDGLHPTNALSALYADLVRTKFSIPLSLLSFDPVIRSGTATFSDSNKTVLTSSATACVICNKQILGKKVFTLTLDTDPASYPGVGVGISTVSASPGFDGNKSIAYVDSGSVIQNSVAIVTTAPGFTASNKALSPIVPTLASVIVDEPNGRAWFTLDGVTFTGATLSLTKTQVEAGIGGFDISAIKALGQLFPVAGSTTTSGHQWRIEAYPVALPAGYTQL